MVVLTVPRYKETACTAPALPHNNRISLDPVQERDKKSWKLAAKWGVTD
jgi:hypothetical protein